jgi:hypothetical protein
VPSGMPIREGRASPSQIFFSQRHCSGRNSQIIGAADRPDVRIWPERFPGSRVTAWRGEDGDATGSRRGGNGERRRHRRYGARKAAFRGPRQIRTITDKTAAGSAILTFAESATFSARCINRLAEPLR